MELPLVGDGGDGELQVAGQGAGLGRLEQDPTEGETGLEVEVVDPAKLGEDL